MENEKSCMGECPYCGSDNITYDAFVKDEHGGHYPATCNVCEGTFHESYNLEYATTYYHSNV